ncbi:MAG: SCO family protein [Thiotrichaceae bacterium]|nr:SCO family protein [Thiotrichaceae bacterium]
MIKKPVLLSLITILVIVLVWVLLFWTPVETSEQPEHQKLALSATPIGGDFTIETKDKDLSLKDLRGKVVVLYMGYTLCPDVCPTSLALLTQALNQMSENELSSVQSVFISVDPDRDNLTRLSKYTQYFHANIMGGTAEKEIIDRIAKQYGAAYQKVENNSAAGYLVDHSSYTYVIDKKGKLRHSLTHGTLPENILKAVRELLAEKG